jgi:hypothetical protein
MPPRKRTTPSTAAQPDVEQPDIDETPAPVHSDKPTRQKDAPTAAAAGGPCAECFPLGVAEDVTSAGCEHGTWNRPT